MSEVPRSVCVYCKQPVFYSITVKDEWSHGSGSSYCQTPHGFTATPLRKATPLYHRAEDVL